MYVYDKEQGLKTAQQRIDEEIDFALNYLRVKGKKSDVINQSVGLPNWIYYLAHSIYLILDESFNEEIDEKVLFFIFQINGSEKIKFEALLSDPNTALYKSLAVIGQSLEEYRRCETILDKIKRI